jgi:ferrochelatase
VKVGIVLFNLGGPDSLDSIEPFLTNLFSDPALLPLPGLFRRPLARLIAKARAPVASEIYKKIGGRSPILEETERQALAIESELGTRGYTAKVFIAMRAWNPRVSTAAEAIKRWNPDQIVLLPLYPQYSVTTTGSSLADWQQAGRTLSPSASHARVCCYPWDDGFITAMASQIEKTFARRKLGVNYRLLLSAHGLPKRMISQGDPYRWQVEKTTEAIVDKLATEGLDWSLCYQSRVGPLEWIGPATDEEIRRAGRDGKGIVLAPVAFVSEHSETLVELDIEYARMASESGVPDYLRAPTVGTHPAFIAGLADMVVRAIGQDAPVTCGHGRICPAQHTRCGYKSRHV